MESFVDSFLPMYHDETNKSLEPDSSSKGLTVVSVSTNAEERLQRQRTP